MSFLFLLELLFLEFVFEIHSTTNFGVDSSGFVLDAIVFLLANYQVSLNGELGVAFPENFPGVMAKMNLAISSAEK